jgi:hypothetical protein
MARPKNCFKYIWKKMKNKDIQKALKINGLDIMNGHALHLIHTRVRVIVIIDDIEMVKKTELETT